MVSHESAVWMVTQQQNTCIIPTNINVGWTSQCDYTLPDVCLKENWMSTQYAPGYMVQGQQILFRLLAISSNIRGDSIVVAILPDITEYQPVLMAYISLWTNLAYPVCLGLRYTETNSQTNVRLIMQICVLWWEKCFCIKPDLLLLPSVQFRSKHILMRYTH